MKGKKAMNKNELLKEIKKAKEWICNSMLLEILEDDILKHTPINNYMDNCLCLSIDKNHLVRVNNNPYPYSLLLRENILMLIKLLKNTLDKYDEYKITDDYIMTSSFVSIIEQEKKYIESKSKPKSKTIKNDCLYLVHDTINNTLKIGRSKNSSSRLKQLQLSTSNKLELLFSIDDKGYLEEELHKRFAKIRLASEWFENDGSIIKYFEEELL